uniref:Uncharacterized protein n=1 Tax=Rhizophora mucronata TaxID=61149 RepID=A0A2P2NQY8_RHIMU
MCLLITLIACEIFRHMQTITYLRLLIALEY